MNTPAKTLRLILALIFFAAAVPKILNPEALAQSVVGYQILPDTLVQFTALTLPWLELLLAILLVCQVWIGPTLLLTNVLFVIFLTALGSAFARGLDVDCGCFGSSTSGNMIWYLIRDVIFLALGLAAAWLYYRELPPRKRTKPVPSVPATDQTDDIDETDSAGDTDEAAERDDTASTDEADDANDQNGSDDTGETDETKETDEKSSTAR
jgi:hypothetical protein